MSSTEKLEAVQQDSMQFVGEYDEREDDYVSSVKEFLQTSPNSSQMYQNLSRYTRFHFKICNTIHTTYFQRDLKTRYITLIGSSVRLFLVKLNVFLHWSYTILTLLYFMSTMRLNRTWEKLLGMAFISAWGVCGLMQTELWNKREEAEFLYKCIIRFENAYLPPKDKDPKRKPPKLDRICSYLMTLGIVSSFGLPGCMTVLLAVNPCMPPHLGYVFFKKGIGECVVNSLLTRILVLSADAYLWVIALPHGLFYVFQGLLVGVRCQDFYLKLLSTGYIGNGRLPLKRDNTCYRIYREIQILNKVFNTVFQGVFFPGVIAVGIFVAIMGMFAILKLRSAIPFPAIMFFPIIASDGLSIIFIAKIAALAFVQSRTFLKLLSSNAKNYKKRSVFNRRIKSMDMIKIRFGGNFCDDLTPLVFLDFWISQTVSLMLLTDK